MRSFFIFSALFFLISTAVSPAEMPEYGYGINIDGDFEPDGVYVFPIPIKVYERAADAALGDVAVFNAAGERVPSALTRPKPTYIDPADIRILFYKETYERDNKTYIKHLVADIDNISGVIETVRFLFNDRGDFSGRISIDYSTGDLGNFIQSDAITLAKLGEIIQDTAMISHIPGNAKYLRLTGDQTALSSISGGVLSFKPEPVYDKIEKVILNGTLDKENNALDFKLTGVYPLEFISLNTPEAYLYTDASLYTGGKAGGERHIYLGLRDYAVIKGVLGYPVDDLRTRQLKILFGEPVSRELAANFYWRADELIFIAKGPPPFTLAYGNISEKGKPTVNYEELAKRSGEAFRLEVSGDELTIAGESALIPPAEETHIVRRTVLLGFMVLTALLVSAIAIRLLIKSGSGIKS
jgi:hypothetical protein